MYSENFNLLDKNLQNELEIEQGRLEQENKQALSEKRFVGTNEVQEQAREAETFRLQQEMEQRLEEHRKKLELRIFENHGGSREAAYKELVEDKKLTNQFQQAAKQKEEQQQIEQRNQQAQSEQQQETDRKEQKKKRLTQDFQAANQNKLQEQRDRDAAKRAQIREQYNLANRQERNRGMER